MQTILLLVIIHQVVLNNNVVDHLNGFIEVDVGAKGLDPTFETLCFFLVVFKTLEIFI